MLPSPYAHGRRHHLESGLQNNAASEANREFLICAYVTVPQLHHSGSTKYKKRSEDTQTLRAGCSKAEPKKFRPAADPFPGGAGRPKFNQLEMVTTFTYTALLQPTCSVCVSSERFFHYLRAVGRKVL